MTQQSNVRYRIINGVRVDFPFPQPLPVRGECFHLGTPKVLKNCNCYANEDHHCGLGKPTAVPSGSCQDCNEWEEK